MDTDRVVTLADLRLSHDLHILAAPFWSYERRKETWWRLDRIEPLWVDVLAELQRLRVKRTAEREQTRRRFREQAVDPNIPEQERLLAQHMVQLESLVGCLRRRSPNRLGGQVHVDPARPATRICIVCEQKFIGVGGIRICTEPCASKRQRATRTQGKPRVRKVTHQPRNCSACNNSFIPKRADAKFCSGRCRVKQHRCTLPKK